MILYDKKTRLECQQSDFITQLFAGAFQQIRSVKLGKTGLQIQPAKILVYV